MMKALFALSEAVRYVALYRDGELSMESRPGTTDTRCAPSEE